MWKYWYHFAVMFEALFILTTIDAGTRIGRFLLQEVAGRVHPSLGRTDWLPGALLSTLVIVLAWAYFINANSMEAIWPMFGIANQMLAVIALAVVSVCIANDGKIRYLWVSGIPMLVVATTTGTASAEMLAGLIDGLRTQWHNAPAVRNQKAILNSSVQAALIIIILLCSAIIVICAARAIWKRLSTTERGLAPSLAVQPI
jgi:carbon starvation protein